jgi:hypothetical protein
VTSGEAVGHARAAQALHTLLAPRIVRQVCGTREGVLGGGGDAEDPFVHAVGQIGGVWSVNVGALKASDVLSLRP